MCFCSITDLVTEIQTRFVVSVRAGVGKSMTFGSSHTEINTSLTSFPCNRCDKKCSSEEELHAHVKTHALDEDVHSATQRLHALTNSTNNGRYYVLVPLLIVALSIEMSIAELVFYIKFNTFNIL